MRVFNMTRIALVLVISLIVILLHTNTGVEARASPTFGHRRLLNLSGNTVELDEVPIALMVGPGNKLIQYFKAEGFQEYVYMGTWKLVNASANLTSFAGEYVGMHYLLPKKDTRGGQPTWQSFSPESLATASLVHNVTMSPNAIPWALMQATETSGSPSRFGAVTFVQRLFTANGLPPESSLPPRIGDIFKSPYTATYGFYTKK